MPNLTIFAGHIYYYQNIFEDPNSIVESLERTDSTISEVDAISAWVPWTASDNPTHIFGGIKSVNFRKYLTSSENIKTLYHTINSGLQEVSEDFKSKLGLDLNLPTLSSIRKYAVGGEMGAHLDISDHSQPVFSAVLYLNDDYEGGELEFERQNIKIKPTAGSMVIFPSAYPFYHASTPIISGEKYLAPCFWYN